MNLHEDTNSITKTDKNWFTKPDSLKIKMYFEILTDAHSM
jgi:hypothetical protein